MAQPCSATVGGAKPADHTIDYNRENVGERIMALTGKAGIDAVVKMDLAANAKLYPGCLHPRAHVVVYGTGSAEPPSRRRRFWSTPSRSNSSSSTTRRGRSARRR